MTIAIGFLYEKGVLLCADSQFTIGSMKMDGMKLGKFDADWGTVVATFSGNVDYASAAFQRCQRELENFRGEVDPVPVIERTLAKFYRKHVFGHPLYKTDDYNYEMLLAIKLKAEPKTKLYLAVDMILHRTGVFCCIGAGGETANAMLRFLCSQERGETDAIALAAYVLAAVKVAVEGCGGRSVIHTLRDDGTFEDHTASKIALHTENIANWFVPEAQRFVLTHTGSDMEFQAALGRLNTAANHIRELWKAYPFNPPTPGLPEGTRHDRLNPLPLLESPGGSGES